MKFKANARFIRFSPYKLRPLVDVVRGVTVSKAVNILTTFGMKRALPIIKTIKSAAANAKNVGVQVSDNQLIVAEIRVDQGPAIRSFRPGAMGRSELRKKRFSHITAVVKVCE